MKFQLEFQSVYFFSRCIGLWPFTIIYHSDGSIKGARIHLFDKLWFLISICLYLTALYYAFLNMKNQTAKNGHISSFIFYLTQIPVLLFSCVSIILDMINRNKLVNTLKKFNIFDSEVCFILKDPFFNSKLIDFLMFLMKI